MMHLAGCPPPTARKFKAFEQSATICCELGKLQQVESRLCSVVPSGRERRRGGGGACKVLVDKASRQLISKEEEGRTPFGSGRHAKFVRHARWRRGGESLFLTW